MFFHGLKKPKLRIISQRLAQKRLPFRRQPSFVLRPIWDGNMEILGTILRIPNISCVYLIPRVTPWPTSFSPVPLLLARAFAEALRVTSAHLAPAFSAGP